MFHAGKALTCCSSKFLFDIPATPTESSQPGMILTKLWVNVCAIYYYWLGGDPYSCNMQQCRPV